MKNAIVFGCGAKNGIPIIDALLDHDYNVTNIGTSILNKKNVTNIPIEWKKIDIPFIYKTFSKITENIDFVFFNQNSSTLTIDDFNNDKHNTMFIWQQIKNWSNSYWLSCQLPFLFLHTLKDRLHKDSKVGWMLSSFIDYKKDNVEEFPDYSSFKFTNYLIMKNFGIKSNFKTFGIIPNFSKNDSKNKLYNLIKKILIKSIVSGKVFKL
jgi:hypothetical protein